MNEYASPIVSTNNTKVEAKIAIFLPMYYKYPYKIDPNPDPKKYIRPNKAKFESFTGNEFLREIKILLIKLNWRVFWKALSKTIIIDFDWLYP